MQLNNKSMGNKSMTVFTLYNTPTIAEVGYCINALINGIFKLCVLS